LEPATVGPVEIGRYLSAVRERAGIKQAELARKITLSPAVLSRIETGDRTLEQDELQTILSAIGTEEALHLSDVLHRDWIVLPRPPLDHPDQELLWEAEKVATELLKLRDSPNIRPAFERRLTEYIAELQQSAALILKREHQIAFIGSIGIGKSTAICRLTGLEVPGQDGGPPVPVLEAGAGGITICEVHLRTGPSYGLLIEPRGEDEIRADVTDFAEYLRASDPAGTEDGQDIDRDSQGISKEIERAIRNMAGLKVRREKDSDGKTTRRDEAKELAERFGSVRELVVEVLARMELHRRDRRDIWYESSSGKTPLAWLKDSFELINNGRHPDVALPRRIEVVVPGHLLEGSNLSVRMIDTKGIDRTAARADLEVHLDDRHTLCVLCSGFNNAPAAEARLLLERARESGIRTLELNAALLVLPRPNEALAVKDEAGIRVETAQEGYELKGEQVSMALQPLNLQRLPAEFFNAHQEDPSHLREFLIGRLEIARQSFRAQISEITKDAELLLLNHEQEQAQEVLRAASKMMISWTTQHTKLPSLKAHVQDSLMDQIGKAYASTVRASVRREGEWPNLSYSHHLGYGARRLAATALGKNVEGFSDLCATLAANPDYKEAIDLIQQADRVLSTTYEELLRKVQLMGQNLFRDELKSDVGFWVACDSEWGRGPGYRDRVSGRNKTWFTASQRQELEQELNTLIEREWIQALERMTALFEK
jgi:transcriptional regulator with XRE-family HTH domain